MLTGIALVVAGVILDVAQGSPDLNGVSDFAGLLARASPAVMLAIFIIALLRRWLILPRELDQCNSRILELEKERDEFKQMAYAALNVGERVASAAEGRRLT